jgi:hypothetical protein
MTVKIKNSGLYISKVNGNQLINNQYAVDIDSDREKNDQVIGMFKNNGVIKTMHDSLQNYMNKTSSKNQSIFDLLKNEHNEINKLPNVVMQIVDSSPKPIMCIPKKMVMKQNTKKKASIYNGISSKLFDFTNIEQAPNPNPNPNPKPKPNNQSRKKRRRRATRRNRKNHKRL